MDALALSFTIKFGIWLHIKKSLDEFENQRFSFIISRVVHLIGSVLGLPLGYLMLVASMKGFVSDAYSFPAEVAPLSYVYTMSLAVIFVLLSQIVVMKNIQKQNWVEALSLKE